MDKIFLYLQENVFFLCVFIALCIALIALLVVYFIQHNKRKSHRHNKKETQNDSSTQKDNSV